MKLEINEKKKKKLVISRGKEDTSARYWLENGGWM